MSFARSSFEKASWLGHVQRLRDLLEEECSEARSGLAKGSDEVFGRSFFGPSCLARLKLAADFNRYHSGRKKLPSEGPEGLSWYYLFPRNADVYRIKVATVEGC